MTDPSERAAFAAYVRDDYQCDDDVHWEEGPGYPDAPFISQDGKYHSLADEVYPAYQRGRSDGQARAALPGRAAAVEAAAQNLYDNRLGWSDGRNPYAPPKFWDDLRAALALPAAPQAERERAFFDAALGEAADTYRLRADSLKLARENEDRIREARALDREAMGNLVYSIGAHFDPPEGRRKTWPMPVYFAHRDASARLRAEPEPEPAGCPTCRGAGRVPIEDMPADATKPCPACTQDGGE